MPLCLKNTDLFNLNCFRIKNINFVNFEREIKIGFQRNNL